MNLTLHPLVEKVLERVHVLVSGDVELVDGRHVETVGQRAVLDQQVEQSVRDAQKQVQHVDHVTLDGNDLAEEWTSLVAVLGRVLVLGQVLVYRRYILVRSGAQLGIDDRPVGVIVAELLFGTLAPDAGKLGIGRQDAQRDGQHLPVGAQVVDDLERLVAHSDLVQLLNLVDELLEALGERGVVLALDLIDADRVVARGCLGLGALVHDGEREVEQLEIAADVGAIGAQFDVDDVVLEAVVKLALRTVLAQEEALETRAQLVLHGNKDAHLVVVDLEHLVNLHSTLLHHERGGNVKEAFGPQLVVGAVRDGVLVLVVEQVVEGGSFSLVLVRLFVDGQLEVIFHLHLSLQHRRRIDDNLAQGEAHVAQELARLGKDVANEVLESTTVSLGNVKVALSVDGQSVDRFADHCGRRRLLSLGSPAGFRGRMHLLHDLIGHLVLAGVVAA